MAEQGDENRPITHRSAVSYIDRTREFYAASGYAEPYRWAHYGDAPFTRLAKPLADCTVGLVTTAAPLAGSAAADGVLRGERRVWAGPTATPPERLFADHLAWDKETTHLDDVDAFLPIRPLQHWALAGRIAAVAEHFYGVPTDYSQRRTRENDAPEILRLCREDGVDAVLLVPL